MFLKSGLMATPLKTGWGERWKLNVKHFTAKTIVSFQWKLSSGVPQECYSENISNADQLIKFAAVLSAPSLLQSTSFSVSSLHSSRKPQQAKEKLKECELWYLALSFPIFAFCFSVWLWTLQRPLSDLTPGWPRDSKDTLTVCCAPFFLK